MDVFPDVVLRRELQGSERLLWSGRPRQGLMLRPSDTFLIPFSLMWGGFAIFWEAMALTMGAPLFFALFGVPFVLAGLYLIAGRFWVDARERKSTYYGITTQRVIIVSGILRRQIKSLGLDTLNDLTLTEGSRGGTITFNRLPLMYAQMATTGWPGQFREPSFELEQNAREVYETLHRARTQYLADPR